MIIKSMLDTDLYKFTTSYAYMKLFPYAQGTFRFVDRDETQYSEKFIKIIEDEIRQTEAVRLRYDELEFMTESCRFIPRVYWEWLLSFRFDPEKIKISLDKEHHLNIEVTDYLYKVTLYEVPILALVSEIRNQLQNRVPDKEEVLRKLDEKIKLSNENKMTFSDFGTRRRFSMEIQDLVIARLKEKAKYCTGTSNCLLAKKYDMKAIGTHPHEWFMFHGAQFGYKHANYTALENWVNVYDGDLGTALCDTYTTDSFLSNFSRKQAKLFDGVRCDSGDEIEFIDNLIQRYKSLGIDPTTKTIIFSNALNFEKALKIYNYCGDRIRCSFGIGTNLTNDTGFKPSNIVMKLKQCRMNRNQRWQECIKLSDDNGKHLGSSAELESCLYELHLKDVEID